MMKRSVKVFATLLVRVEGLNGWGEDHTMAQVEKQARESAIGMLQRLVKDEHNVRIIQFVKLETSLTSEEVTTL